MSKIFLTINDKKGGKIDYDDVRKYIDIKYKHVKFDNLTDTVPVSIEIHEITPCRMNLTEREVYW